MVELVDSEDLGSSAVRRVGSSPTTRTSDRPAFCDKNAGRLLLLPNKKDAVIPHPSLVLFKG